MREKSNKKDFKSNSNRGSYWKLTSASKLHLTWNDRDSFQCSENPECSQRRYIPQVHKLCYISEIREDHTQTPMTTTNTPKTPPRQRTTRRYVTHRACPLRGERKEKKTKIHTRTPNTDPTPPALTHSLTWDYRNSFQCPQNSERAQSWDIA